MKQKSGFSLAEEREDGGCLSCSGSSKWVAYFPQNSPLITDSLEGSDMSGHIQNEGPRD
jgi:hypothetical protein